MSEVSYSLHLGSKNNAIKDVKKLGFVNKHNTRENEDVKILFGTNDVVTDVVNLYRKEFDNSLKEYNEKQTREDRKINDYFTHVNESNKNIANEIIIQVGDMEYWNDIDFKKNENAITNLYMDQINALKKIIPDFKIANITLHLDEASPHLHVVGVPISSNNKRGLDKQVSQSKVFTQEKMKSIQDEMRMETSESVKNILNAKYKTKEEGFDYLEIKRYKAYKMKQDEETEKIIKEMSNKIKKSIDNERNELNNVSNQLVLKKQELEQMEEERKLKEQELNDVKEKIIKEDFYNRCYKAIAEDLTMGNGKSVHEYLHEKATERVNAVTKGIEEDKWKKLQEQDYRKQVEKTKKELGVTESKNKRNEFDFDR